MWSSCGRGLLLGPHWVRTEAEEGRQRDVLVPVLIDGEARIPLAFRLIQAARLMDWQDTGPHPEFERLLQALTDIISPPALVRSAAPSVDTPVQLQSEALPPRDEAPSISLLQRERSPSSEPRQALAPAARRPDTAEPPEEIKRGSERREISILFSDMAGFTPTAERFAPEALMEFLNAYLGAMTDTLLQHRGHIDKYIGDAIMALFGAPNRAPNHATLACYAALDCQQMLAHRHAAWQQHGFPELSTRIGINSGLVLLGNMGSEKHMEYTAMGDSVNLASRLEWTNKVYNTLILLGPRTYELAKDDIEAREVDRIRVTGKREPVLVYELLGRKGALSPQKQQIVKAFGSGLAAYKQCDFVTAQGCFEEVLQLGPGDGPAQEYLRRVKVYRASPPPPGWDGVYGVPGVFSG